MVKGAGEFEFLWEGCEDSIWSTGKEIGCRLEVANERWVRTEDAHDRTI